MELLGHRGAAQHGAALEHANRETRAREIRGAGEAVVAAADDDGVEASRDLRRRVVMPARRRIAPRLQSSLSPAATMENPLST